MSKFFVRLEQLLACCLALLLIVPVTEAATTPLPSAPQPQLIATPSQPASPDAASPHSSPQDQQQQSPSAAQQSSQSQPVGTAAAPVLKPDGVPGSRPAGAAIAPAKQRRIRRFTIRVALLVGAGIAVGTVAAASLGSPSHPH